MKVKAIESGFYGKYRNAGEDFFIKDESELGSWMEVIEEANQTYIDIKEPVPLIEEKEPDTLPVEPVEKQDETEDIDDVPGWV